MSRCSGRARSSHRGRRVNPTNHRSAAAAAIVKSVCSTAQATPKTITADAGYWDTTSLQDPSLKGIEVLVSPDSNPQPPGAPLPPSAPRNEEAIRMREALASQEGKARYALRKSTVEPVFGQIKEARGIRRFRLRGVSNVTSEWKHLRHAQSLKTIPPPCCHCLCISDSRQCSASACLLPLFRLRMARTRPLAAVPR